MPDPQLLDGRTLLITGVTGSLGGAFLERIRSGSIGRPARIVGFSRDEAKQHELRRRGFEDELPLELRLGDIRDRDAITEATRGVDWVLHSAALKQVPICERQPAEAIATNVGGAENLVRAVHTSGSVSRVVAISTDKACLPVSALGLTKALAERLFSTAHRPGSEAEFINLRPGNLLSSRGSVVPHFLEQIERGGPVTLTDPGMTRYFLSIDEAIDAVVDSFRWGSAGETVVPDAPSIRLGDLAAGLIGDRKIEVEVTGVRPGERIHEFLVSETEAPRTVRRAGRYVIAPEVAIEGAESRWPDEATPVDGPVTSETAPLSSADARAWLERNLNRS